MNKSNALLREIKFAGKDRSLWIWLAIVFSFSVLSVNFGLLEVKRQTVTIQNLLESDKQDRIAELKKQEDWGSAAYYSFHLTYDPPSDFAFAAMGQRDIQPWKHRIRMLAIEGQIYERDVANPSVALIGRFDFAFLTAFIIPLVLIMLLYDLRANERTAGRHNLLEATAGHAFSFWLLRTCLRSGALFLCLIIPLIVVSIMAGTTLIKLVLASVCVLVYIVFWTLLCFIFSAWRKPSSTILMSLLAVWITTAVILPAGARTAIDQLVPVPSGADIVMLQRESVNGAWDMPRETTMDAFFKSHPEWSAYEPENSSFEWQWYYAFQQVGDEITEKLSTEYRTGRIERARIANWVSLLTPPSLFERALQFLAKTDLNASIRYENKVRSYHAALRNFYYPKFFRNEPFDQSFLKNLPEFEP